jgi:predicted DNA-binding transcriptional regulator YafY
MKRTTPSPANPAREVRLVRLVNILRRGKAVSRESLEDELEVSRATLTRDITTLRDQLNMPIAFDRDAGGYIVADKGQRDGPRYELPGIWLSGAQAFSVLTMVNVLMSIDPGILWKPLSPLRSMVKQVLSLDIERPPPVDDKLAIEIAYRDDYDPEIFQSLSTALYQDHEVRLSLVGSTAPPNLYSLQRYALTLDGWFVDAYNRSTEAVNRISVETIASVEILGRPAVRLRYREDPARWETARGAVIPHDYPTIAS